MPLGLGEVLDLRQIRGRMYFVLAAPTAVWKKRVPNLMFIWLKLEMD